MIDSDLIYKKWKSEFEILEKETNLFRTYFISTKKCNCPIELCRHYRDEKHRIFGNKIDELFNLRMKISSQTFAEANNSISTN